VCPRSFGQFQPSCFYQEIKVSSRRFFFRQAFGISAGAAAIPAARAAQQMSHQQAHAETSTTHSKIVQSGSAPPNVSVITPDLGNLPFTVDNGVKVFHLIAEPVRRAILPNRTLDLWGYNGSSPGPTIEVNEGDRIRIIFENRLPEPSSMHWHGIELPNDMDGAPGLPFAPVKPGDKFTYEFTLHQNGTYFYHPHLAMQEMMGMLGAFIIHPKTPYEPRVDKDYVILLQEYAVLPNNTVPNSMNM
jgi:manganese oxidase